MSPADDDTDSHDAPEAPPPAARRLLLHAALFLGSFLTTSMAGALYVHGRATGEDSSFWGMLQQVMPIQDGLAYSVPLMGILLCHELGHYLVARWHGVPASLPYFIPFPPFAGLGTMGAVIGMKEVTTDRKKLIDIAAAGPLAGLLVAVPVILYGLAHSKVGPVMAFGQQEGNSLLYSVLKHSVKGVWLPNGQQDVYLHPTAWAGWAGLLVTMINLLPIGQLDGGHIATAYFGNGYNTFARRLHAVLPFIGIAVVGWVYHLVHVEMGSHWNPGWGIQIGLVAGLPWLVWYALVAVLRGLSGGANHPPVDTKPLPASRKLLFWLMVAVFVSIFMPVPFRTTMTGEPPPDSTSASLDGTP